MSFRSFAAAGRRLFARLGVGLDPIVPMLPLAAGIGCIGALAVEAFRRAMLWLMHFYSPQDHLVAAAAGLPPWQRVLWPTLGASAAGVLMWAGQRWIRNARGPEYMEAVRVGDGHLPFRANILRTAASLFAVSGGMTIGREGSMIQFGALIASQLGRLAGAGVAHRRVIVACGAAASFAAAYHAPIAGTLFVAEIILGGLELREIAAILVAAVFGELGAQTLAGGLGPLYAVRAAIPPVRFTDVADATLLGVLAGVVGAAFLWMLDSSRRLYQNLGLPLPLRLGLAGLCVGLLSLASPYVWGNGYAGVQSMLLDHWGLGALALVFVLRLLGVVAASAAGVPGGVLTPSLVLGAALGLFVAQLLLLPTATHAPALWTVVGMGSLLAATTHAPTMCAVMMFETTRHYDVVLATMPACVVASVISSLLRRRSVYAEALGLGDDGAAARQASAG